MNNRLSEIAESILSTCTHIDFDAFVQEFGKLVIEEAAIIADSDGDLVYREIGAELKQHFGVWDRL